jgi:rhamnulokinase
MVDGLLLTDEVARFGNTIVERDGRFYWDIHQLLAHITAALGKLASQGVKVRSIGVDTWGVDFGLLDAEGHLLSAPRAYRDPYTDGAPASYFTHIARSEVYARTGIQVMNFNTLFQLYAMSQESPDLLRAARSLLFMPDLISWFLTGKRVCEYTILSTSQFLNPYTKRIDADLLKPCGVSPELFAEVVMPGTVVGLLRDEVPTTRSLPTSVRARGRLWASRCVSRLSRPRPQRSTSPMREASKGRPDSSRISQACGYSSSAAKSGSGKVKTTPMLR